MELIFDQMFEALPIELQIKMKSTYQDHRWHPECDVYSHSRLVAQHLQNSYTLQTCALLHDIGKCFTTEAKETDFGIKITSFNHESFLEKDSLFWGHIVCRFSSLDINWACVFDVCKQHMRMHKYNDGTIKKKFEREAIEKMQYFEEMKLFANADKRGVGTEEDKLPYVIVTVGISGSGKSTWRKQFIDKANFCAISPDDLRKEFTGSVSDQSMNSDVWKTAYAKLDYNIKYKFNTVFDSTMCNVKTIKEIMSRCKDKAIVIFMLFECDPDVAACRVNADLQNKIDRSAVPREVIQRQHEGFKLAKKFICDEGFLELTN